MRPAPVLQHAKRVLQTWWGYKINPQTLSKVGAFGASLSMPSSTQAANECNYGAILTLLIPRSGAGRRDRACAAAWPAVRLRRLSVARRVFLNRTWGLGNKVFRALAVGAVPGEEAAKTPNHTPASRKLCLASGGYNFA